MKLLATVLLSASLMACGGKAKKNTTPDNKTGTTGEVTTDGTGGTTYGGGQTTPAPTEGGQ